MSNDSIVKFRLFDNVETNWTFGNNVEETFDTVERIVQLVAFDNDKISTQNSFDIVAVFGNKVERCFDIVADVDRA